MSAGNDGWGRLFGAASPRVASGYLLGALEMNQNDGPWVRPDDYRKLNGILPVPAWRGDNGFALTGMGYWADWDSSDQVPERAIADGLIPRFGLLDGSDGGKANRESLAAEFQRSSGPSSLRATGFLLHNSLNLFSNFTYFLDDPANGDQFEQAERRVAAGGRVTYRRLGHFLERHTESAVGVQLRRDWLESGRPLSDCGPSTALDHARGRSRPDHGRGLCAKRGNKVNITFRTTFGLRADLLPVFGELRQLAELGRRLRQPGESEGRSDPRALERHRAVRECRHRLSQQ